ncbi:hypothetical protein AWC38_SpisGene24435 [Stylophora pistillata]|uniref:Uncharacterized protein n=1 Tax=Stylophora pistillata TaxID=50429 RepID=A0A2B4R676_STYPI|nr:hypothetical protein AWC38_SpisGene24435 [Stylophora pistillata]
MTENNNLEARTSTANTAEGSNGIDLASVLLGLQNSIAQLTRASETQGEAFHSLKDEIFLQPEPADTENEEDEPSGAHVDPTVTMNNLIADASKTATAGHILSGGAKNTSASGAGTDILDSLTQALLSNTKKSKAVDAKIASLIANIVTGDLPEATAKKKGEKYPPPENCEHLPTVPVNEEIWDLISQKNRSVDLAFQKVQEPLVQGRKRPELNIRKLTHTVREEIRRQGQNNNERVESASTSSKAASREANKRTASRLSGFLDRIRGQSRGKKRKTDKEHRIQVRWIHYDEQAESFVPLGQMNGGGNRFVVYTALEPPTVEELKQKATALLFPEGRSAFVGAVDDMLLDICDRTRMVTIRFPGEGTIVSYLKENGLYPSKTHLYLRSQHQDTFFSQLKADEETFERPVNLNASQVASDAGQCVVCSVCSCSYLEGEECVRCEQKREYELSRIADGGNPYTTETPETPVALTMDEIRSRRVAVLSNSVAEIEAEGSHSNVADETSYPMLTNEENCNLDQGPVEQNCPCPSSSGNLPEIVLSVHRSCIRI